MCEQQNEACLEVKEIENKTNEEFKLDVRKRYFSPHQLRKNTCCEACLTIECIMFVQLEEN